MTMMAMTLFAALLNAAPAAVSGSRPASDAAAWVFNSNAGWAGWTPNPQVREIQFAPDNVSFRTAGSDPSLVSPRFAWPAATNGQHVEIDLDCDGPGEGELYFTNAFEGENGGFQGKWYVPVAVPGPGRRLVPVWPFWETLGEVVRLRFDPPSGTGCRLYGIRIVQDHQPPATPAWDFTQGASSWQPMYAAELEPTDSGLRVRAGRPMALVATATTPFEAAGRSLLRLSVDCPGESTICLYWATREETGLWGEPIELPGGIDRPITLDLRQFAEWRGTITNLALGFGTHGGETVTLRSLDINETDAVRPFVRLRYLGYTDGVARPGRPARVRAIVEHAAGPSVNSGQADMQTDVNAECADPRVEVPAMQKGDRADLTWTVVPRGSGETRVSVSYNGQRFTRTLRVDPPVGEIATAGYPVPEPHPVRSDYQIGVYYYPGWSDPKMGAWKRQAELPERDPLLGWYPEGLPEVADWHIKWAVENGISFFVYDWYWRNGREEQGAALNHGLLNARYLDRIKFAVMWANHRPFADHTPEQLLTVTDYWIERYLRRPNYLTIGGKPYVSIYAPDELLSCLGSPTNVREALDAMRERVRQAGLAGLHIAAIDVPGRVDAAALKASGFDSLTAYTYIRTGSPASHSLYRAWLAGYREKWEQASAGGLPYVPVLAAGWDGPVWYGPRSERRRGRRTGYWAEGLGRLKAYLDETGGRTAMLEAWNEWGEGAYIEPNVEFGFGDLEAIRSTFARPGDWPVNIGPEDLGLGGQYDQRRRSPSTSPS